MQVYVPMSTHSDCTSIFQGDLSSVSCIFLLNLSSLSYTRLASLKILPGPLFSLPVEVSLQSEGQMPGDGVFKWKDW